LEDARHNSVLYICKYFVNIVLGSEDPDPKEIFKDRTTLNLTITDMFVFSGRTDYETGIKPASHRLERHAPACASAPPPPPKGPATTPTPAHQHQQPPDHVKISLFHSRHYRPPPPPPSSHTKVTHPMESLVVGEL
jgi:hypothetical protein